MVYRPAEAGAAQADVKLDYVGSLENAAVVISRLHRGEKRLVFVDSRPERKNWGRACGNSASRPSSRTVRSARNSDGRRKMPSPTAMTA